MPARLSLFVANVLAAALLAAGCGSSPEPVARPGNPSVGPAVGPAEGDPLADPGLDAAIEATGRHTARTAAQIVASMPAVSDLPTQRELALHTTLYRAAHETNVGEFTGHFLLEPRPKDPALAIDEAEFRLRVLAGLADLGVPVAWVPRATRPGGDPDAFPGTRHPATHLSFRVLERDEGGTRIRGRITDRTTHVATSSQKVTAVWVGGGWTLERDPVRLVY